MSHTLQTWSRVFRLQPLVWLALGALYFVFDQGVQEERIFLFLAMRSFVWALVGALVTALLLRLYALVKLDARPMPVMLTSCALGCLGAALSCLLLYDAIDKLIGIEPGYESVYDWPRAQFFSEYFSYVFVIAIWHGIVMAYVHFHRAAAERERSIKMRQLVTESRMSLLRGQLGPHFLFNSLNAAIALINENPSAAQLTLTDLSELLRQTLNRSGESEIKLEDEMAIIAKYINIEKTRYEDKLAYDVSGLSKNTGACLLPPFLIQPLVENAVKHGMQTSAMPLKVKVSSHIDGDNLTVEVANTGDLTGEVTSPPRPDKMPYDGIGIGNLIERLDVELNGRHSFSLTKRGEWVCAVLKIQCTTLSSVTPSESQ